MRFFLPHGRLGMKYLVFGAESSCGSMAFSNRIIKMTVFQTAAEQYSGHGAWISILANVVVELGRRNLPSNFTPQDDLHEHLETNEIVRLFQLRATAELKRELDEVKWWEDRVRRGLVKRGHADGHIQAAKRVTRMKRHILGFPEFPCRCLSRLIPHIA
jgi:hypothetical protein